jgi:hypothetical protein
VNNQIKKLYKNYESILNSLSISQKLDNQKFFEIFENDNSFQMFTTDLLNGIDYDKEKLVNLFFGIRESIIEESQTMSAEAAPFLVMPFTTITAVSYTHLRAHET